MHESTNLNLLELSKKEERVLISLQNNNDTPLLLARKTKVSRPAVYAILQNLKKRGLADSYIIRGKKRWRVASEREIENVLYAAKSTLLKIPAGRQEVQGLSDATVVVHRGAEAVRGVLVGMLSTHKNERFYGFAGDTSSIAWNKLFSLKETNQFNRTLKKNNIIAETILQEGLLERETKNLGIEWAKEFEGRTTKVNIVDRQYFENAAQMFIFRESIYIMALGEEIVIEIRNSEIKK